MRLEVDYTDGVSARLQALAKAFPKAGARAVGVAGARLWQDIIHEEPRPHIMTGYTRNSISLHVAGKLRNNPSRGPETNTYDGKTYTSGQSSVPSSVSEGGMEAVVAVNSPYAARLHELPPDNLGPRSRADSGVGPKFVEAKIIRNQDRYVKIFAEQFSKALEEMSNGQGEG